MYNPLFQKGSLEQTQALLVGTATNIEVIIPLEFYFYRSSESDQYPTISLLITGKDTSLSKPGSDGWRHTLNPCTFKKIFEQSYERKKCDFFNENANVHMKILLKM